jgi:hypothetical protein
VPRVKHLPVSGFFDQAGMARESARLEVSACGLFPTPLVQRSACAIVLPL